MSTPQEFSSDEPLDLLEAFAREHDFGLPNNVAIHVHHEALRRWQLLGLRSGMIALAYKKPDTLYLDNNEQVRLAIIDRLLEAEDRENAGDKPYVPQELASHLQEWSDALKDLLRVQHDLLQRLASMRENMRISYRQLHSYDNPLSFSTIPPPELAFEQFPGQFERAREEVREGVKKGEKELEALWSTLLETEQGHRLSTIRDAVISELVAHSYVDIHGPQSD